VLHGGHVRTDQIRLDQDEKSRAAETVQVVADRGAARRRCRLPVTSLTVVCAAVYLLGSESYWRPVTHSQSSAESIAAAQSNGAVRRHAARWRWGCEGGRSARVADAATSSATAAADAVPGSHETPAAAA